MKITKYSNFIFLILSVGTSAWAQNATVSVLDYGALNDGSNPGATTNAFWQAFLAAAPGGKVVVPPGSYAIDNSNGGFVVNGFNGEVKFDGGANVVLQSASVPGLVFNGGWGLRLNGLNITYPSYPTGWVASAAALMVNGTVNLRASDIMIQGSPAYGIWIVNALEPKVINATVTNSLDDGIRFENSRNSQISGATVMQAGQTGLDFVTPPGATAQGGTASNIIVRASGQGVGVNGTSDVTLSSIYTEQTAGDGIYCGSGKGGASPNGVLFQGGVIADAGGFGVEIGPVTSCGLANLQVLNSASSGVYVNANFGNVSVSNVRVNNNLSDDAFSFMFAGEVLLSESAASNSPKQGFFFDTVNRVVANGLTTFNVAQAFSLNRAIWFQNIGNLAASNLAIADTQITPTGYIVGDFNVTKGSIQNIASTIAAGSLQVQNLSTAGVSVLQVN